MWLECIAARRTLPLLTMTSTRFSTPIQWHEVIGATIELIDIAARRRRLPSLAFRSRIYGRRQLKRICTASHHRRAASLRRYAGRDTFLDTPRLAR